MWKIFVVVSGFTPAKRVHEESKRQMHDDVPSTSTPVPRRRPVKVKPDLKVKCGACGAVSIYLLLSTMSLNLVY